MRKKRKRKERDQGVCPRLAEHGAVKASVGLEGHLRRQDGGKGQGNQVHLLPPSLGKAPGMFRELATGEVRAIWVN